MYRVLLSRTGVAYAKECDDEFDFVDNLNTLKDSMGLEHEIKIVDGDR